MLYLRHFQLTFEFLASHHPQHISYQAQKINVKKENHTLIKNKNEQILSGEDFFPRRRPKRRAMHELLQCYVNAAFYNVCQSLTQTVLCHPETCASST